MTNFIDKDTEKMANLGRMTRGILHDLNNSLASIMGFASFLSDDLEPTSEQYVFAENIKKAGTQIENLVEQIRALSMERGTSKDVTLNIVDAINQIIESSKLSITQNQQIHLVSDVKSAFIKIVPFQFKIMFTNLLKNALQSLGNNSGTIMIHISSPDDVTQDNLKGEYHYILQPYEFRPTDKKMIRIDIIDTGCGMDDVTLNLASSPHYTTKSADIAHGLGLSVSSQIVHYLGGNFIISTTPRIGTRVTIVLPVEKIIL